MIRAPVTQGAATVKRASDVEPMALEGRGEALALGQNVVSKVTTLRG